MGSLIFVCCSDQSHVDVMVVYESAVLDCAQYITHHKRVVLTESLDLSLKAVKCSRLSDSATFFVIVIFENPKRIFDPFTRL